ncbi:MAG: sugar-transfer associated ATP-grasp domain-containing protein [Opitutaceae bacterium]
MISRFRAKLRNTIYHLKIANWRCLSHYNELLSGSGRLPIFSLLYCSWKHGASFENYYELRFFQQTPEERRTWITASLRHELTRQVNDCAQAKFLKNKQSFLNKFGDLLGRECFAYNDLMNESQELLSPGRFVIKHRFGQAGQEVYFPDQVFQAGKDLCCYIGKRFERPEDYLCERFIVQHPDLERLNPSCLNTLRIMTYLDKKTQNVDIWGVFLRLGVGGEVDNLAAGGIAAEVGSDGIVTSPGVFKNPFKEKVSNHPLTKEKVVGFQVPFYHEAIELAVVAAKRVEKVRSVGWDVAITADGPCLIEGNDNWCMTLFQITSNSGSRSIGSSVCDMHKVYD